MNVRRLVWALIFALGVLLWYVATKAVIVGAHEAERGFGHPAPRHVQKTVCGIGGSAAGFCMSASKMS
jgi:hypothetical protein